MYLRKANTSLTSELFILKILYLHMDYFVKLLMYSF